MVILNLFYFIKVFNVYIILHRDQRYVDSNFLVYYLGVRFKNLENYPIDFWVYFNIINFIFFKSKLAKKK